MIFVLLKEEDEQEITHLCEEATMPIEDVIAKYNSGRNEKYYRVG